MSEAPVATSYCVSITAEQQNAISLLNKIVFRNARTETNRSGWYNVVNKLL